MPKTVTFNVRLVNKDDADFLTRLAQSIGIPRERYIRKLFQLHVEAERARRRVPGRYELDVPTAAQVANAMQAEA